MICAFFKIPVRFVVMEGPLLRLTEHFNSFSTVRSTNTLKPFCFLKIQQQVSNFYSQRGINLTTVIVVNQSYFLLPAN